MKPDKIRVVFDCSATFKGQSLNKELLQGPDLTNMLVGVLTRFRLEEIAIMGDIESMFYQVRVPEEQYNFLRYIWWPDGQLDKDMEEYQMCVHLFGAGSSPSCSNFALRKTAIDNQITYGVEAEKTLLKNFYVDDMLKSCINEASAQQLLCKVKSMCAAGGFNLTKMVSNSRSVIDSIEASDKGKSLKELDLTTDVLPVERVLGVHWCIENDTFGFRITLKDKPLTRRGILSSVSSIYDPLGFAAPFLLQGRLLLQQLCSEKKAWDEEITSDQRIIWEKWRLELKDLEKVEVNRCIKPKDFGDITDMSIHHFSDASDKAYGTASYLRVENNVGNVNCTLLMGKSRVAPIKPVTVPRLELTAASVSIKVGSLLQQELDFENIEELYWTDSTVVLGYLQNETKRFHVFVANRVKKISDHSKVEQWKYVKSEANPADDATRGLGVEKFLKSKRWFNGPNFLYESMQKIRECGVGNKFMVDNDDPEVKKVKVNKVSIEDDFLTRLTSRTNRWVRLKRIVATMLKWSDKKKSILVDDLVKAEVINLRLLQRKVFHQEIETLKKGETGLVKTQLKQISCLFRLNPFIDENGVLRVGGRLSKSTLGDGIKYPVILPYKEPVTVMIIQWCHEQVQHGGRGMTINGIRNTGYWVIKVNTMVRNLIYRCVLCKYLRGKTSDQKMADLPLDRIEECPVFTNCGVDMFGPFLIKEGRKELKRYGALFTCLVSRAVHIESTCSLETDSFIQALRRFIARRGNIRKLRSDNGTNFVGADRELIKALNEMDQVKISEFLQIHGADWIPSWDRNPPASSHFGGVWERQIRTARMILSSLLKTHGHSLNEESFRTLLVEVEGIMNSRPLTVDNLSDPDTLVPISPATILTMKSNVILPPPGEFERADLYSRRRWRRIQHIANEFWSRWRKEYLLSLQQRKKWQCNKRNFKNGDVVILKESNEFRNDWKLSRICNTHSDSDGIVRSVDIKTGDGQYLTRPIHKLVLLVESD